MGEYLLKLDIKKMEPADIDEALHIFRAAYKNMSVPEDEDAHFEQELRASFKSDHLIFFKAVIDEEMKAFAAIEELSFARGAWALRWGTTRPDMQKKGIMSALTKFRLQYADEHTQGYAGIVQIMSRSPGLYKKLGFQELYQRGPENAATFMFKLLNKERKALH